MTKAIHVTGPDALEEAQRYASLCHGLHLDSRTSDRLGGTGQVHDWSISCRIVEAIRSSGGPPVILSGGLRPENLQQAVQAVVPYAVDVNSGVEDSAGDKDPERVTAFVSIARAALVQRTVARVGHPKLNTGMA